MRARSRRLTAAGLACSLVGFLALAGRAATPSSISLGPDRLEATWAGPVVEASSIEAGQGCAPPASFCDELDLNVDVTPTYWDDHTGGIKLEVHWEKPSDQFELWVYDDSGTVVAVSGTLPPDRQDTSQAVTIPRASGRYRVEVRYYLVANAGYEGTAGFVSEEGGAPLKGRGAFFDSSSELRFGPATVVSAHFLGGEPNVTIERSVGNSPPSAVDAGRVFVDWPLSTRITSSQLSRSVDGGESFRLLFDPLCAERSRPVCETGGGGDSYTAVSPFDGTLYYTDQEGIAPGGGLPGIPVHEAVASSTDHGDTFPPQRQFTTTNTALVVDRQWLAATNPETASVGPRGLGALFSYHLPGPGQYIQGIDEDGAPLPQPAPQLTRVGQSGPIRVDNTGGPGDGWVYQPYLDDAFEVATAPVNGFQDPSAWEVNKVTDDLSEVFPWLDLDARGNAYAVWVEGGAVYMSSSPIDDPRNDPGAGGRPGTYWSPLVRLSLPSVTSATFGEVAAGAQGRIAIAYDGTTDHKGVASQAGPDAKWRTYAAVVTNALGTGGPPVVNTGIVSDRVVHTGSINGSDASLLDFIDVDVDAAGRVGVAFTDNHSAFAEDGLEPKARPFALFAKEVAGPSLLSGDPIQVVVPTNARSDALADARWPNASGGRLIGALDFLGSSLTLEDGMVVARMPLNNGTRSRMDKGLDAYNESITSAPAATRFQYVVRFATADDVYHLSMEAVPGEELRFFGGKLDDNDRFTNLGTSTVLGAGYHADSGYHVSGTVKDNLLVLEAPAAEFGVGDGSRLFSVTAFAMAGPAEADESLTNMMRTVDATPPFDALLSEGPAASPPPAAEIHLFLSPEDARREVGDTHEVTAVVTDGQGIPMPGIHIDWQTQGIGSIAARAEETDDDGLARAEVTSRQPGDQQVVATASGCEDPACIATARVTWNTPGCDITGTPGGDVLRGGPDDETLCGGKGNDVIRAFAGNDMLIGGAGRDVTIAGRGNDVAKGDRGRDRLRGGRGRDRLYGRRGRDVLRGGPGRDRLRGGRGRDNCRPGASARRFSC